jgi:hypothetical protein
MPITYPNILTSNSAEYTVNMTNAFAQAATSMALFGEVFVKFDTTPLLELSRSMEFDEDIREMREIDGTAGLLINIL